MEEEEDMLPPFWQQNGSTDSRGRRRAYSVFLSSGALLIFLLVTALAFTFILVPTLHSFTSNIFKPHSVKKSWDSLNLLLVLFAIICGFLSRNTNESPRSYEDQSFSDTAQDYTKPYPETQQPWYEYSDRTPYKSHNRLRSFNSYPDLRQESLWAAADEQRWRFYDDTHVNGYRELDLDAREEELGIKNIEVDTFISCTKEVPRARQPPASPPPSPPPAPRSGDDRRNAKKTYRASGQPENMNEKSKHGALRAERLQPQPQPPPPPPPPPPIQMRTEQNKKKGGSATKEFLTSLKGKKKKQRQRSLENFERILNSKPPTTLPLHPPPPPPPPPPPSSVFHNLFSSKKSKHKKINSASPPPPPRHISSMRVYNKTEQVHGSVANLKPWMSNTREDFYALEENVVTGNESPLIPIPPPPPPPPFKMPAWKFRVQGDFVRIDSISSSSSGSPDLDEVVESPSIEASQRISPFSQDGGEREILLFHPSPDVDTKADTFIEKFRAGLRMEKMNSTKEKQGIGKSNLRPSPKTENKQENGPR
ncbi:verprolin [Gastrolobium bilobum]|uniref:verprolin n=1 Tax=Gastrolobium bilobum TaxID=150636 RepID=UPI002AB26ED0|nr:verprolin [Gastrolobium bilobum]